RVVGASGSRRARRMDSGVRGSGPRRARGLPFRPRRRRHRALSRAGRSAWLEGIRRLGLPRRRFARPGRAGQCHAARPAVRSAQGARRTVGRMAQALVTAVAIGTLGLGATAVLGLLGTDLSRHITIGIFSTMITLLAHSMMMFYLIGKGKAVKDAMAEGGHRPDEARYREYVGRIAASRRPVFSVGTFAMAATIVTALVGASVDTG